MRPFLAFLRGKKFSLLRIRFHPTAQRLDGVDKLIGLLKAAMDRRKTEIGDFIDIAQFCHHVRADLCRSDFVPDQDRPRARLPASTEGGLTLQQLWARQFFSLASPFFLRT